MSQELLINITPMETRVALVENGVPQDIFVERNNKQGLVGNIYKGKVVRVLPGMQAAFIDIGEARTAFLHMDDLLPRKSKINAGDNGEPDIRKLLHDGQQLVVQVIKDPVGSKGARLSAQLSLASHYLVYMVEGKHLGVSQRIESEQERERLKLLLGTVVDEVTAEEASLKKEPKKEPSKNTLAGGYILRTAADGAEETELRNTVRFLRRLWQDIVERKLSAKAPCCLYEDLPLYKRVLRDMVGTEVEKIRVDSREVFEKLTQFGNKFNPDIVRLLEHYPGERPLFYMYAIEDEITKALQRKVMLKSGGHIVFDQTEAMSTIDVNTGAFVGHRNLEETIYKTNLEAAAVIARQMRIRNLGGIIIIDFIDMHSVEHRRQVLRALEKALARDPVRTTISGVTELGLVQTTRKRTRQSLGQILCEECPTCFGRGYVKSAESISYEILRDILRAARAYECDSLRVLASAPVIERLTDEDSSQVADLELFINCTIQFRVESLYGLEQFDIIPV
ncbi:MAG: ribonuclease G [Porticoccaceae bacterium]|nr:ribonuclease G [Porticoccaceae bacterium]